MMGIFDIIGTTASGWLTDRTRPRRSSNQRFAMMAARTIDVTPVPVPTNTPHNSVSCHWVYMRVVSATERPSSATAPRTTRRSPHRSITDAANDRSIRTARC